MTDSTDVLANISLAIYSKFTAVDGGGASNSFFTAVNGQLYEDMAPEGAQYPYAVYTIAAAPKERTFTEIYTNIFLELSIFSSNSSSAEIKDIYQKAVALYDEKSLTITGSTLVWMREDYMTAVVENVITPSGTQMIRTYHVDFDVRTSLN
jgi:hypothetical protein